jgi:hypothetical protein
VVEQVIADSKASALAHLPSGHFHANAAWLTLWAMTYMNFPRDAGHSLLTLRGRVLARVAVGSPAG